MSITHFPHGVLATPNIGGSRLVDIWNSENIFFVDGDNGSAGSEGRDPSDANTLISTIINSSGISRGASIYVRPRTTATSTQTYYMDNIVVPLTLPNLSIIGAGFYGCHNSFSGVQIKPATAGIAVSLIKVKGAGCLIENMRLAMPNGTASTGTSIIQAYHATTTAPGGDDGTEKKPTGLIVRGCQFASTTSSPTNGIAMGGAIGLGSVSQCLIEDNIFFACKGGITMTNTSGTANNQIIRGNVFCGTISTREVDILNDGNGTGIVIVDNVFADGVPTGGGAKFIKILGTGSGIISRNSFASAQTATGFGTTGTVVVCPTTFFLGGNFYEGTTTAVSVIGRQL